MSKKFYVLRVVGDVEPELHGPYETKTERDNKARSFRKKTDDDGIFRLDVTNNTPTVSAYGSSEIDPEAIGLEFEVMSANSRYVLNCGDEMLQLIKDNMNCTMTSSNQAMVAWEEIVSWTETYSDIDNPSTPDEILGVFLCRVEQQIIGEVGDVIFSA
jgi:hypothetical protein